MIKIKHIKAHMPSKNCQLSFMVRKKQQSSQSKLSDVKLTQDYVDIDINCVVQLRQFANCKQPVQLCAIAVTDDARICVGSVDIDVRSSKQNEESRLKGVQDQDGYIVYDLVKEEKVKSTRSFDRPQVQVGNPIKSQTEKKTVNSRTFIKYKNSSSGSSASQNQFSFESKSGSQSPFRKNKTNHEVNSEEYFKLLDELYHEVLEEQLFNQRAWNKIQQNQIFQLRYKQRIQALIGNSCSFV